MRWILPKVDEASAAMLVRDLGLHPVAARVLVARGLATAEAAKELFQDSLTDLPDPSRMKGIEEAVTRLVRALRSSEKITLYGDYDVDGVTSSAILATFLRAVGATDVATYTPLRLDEGYGLNAEAVERIARDGTRLLVSLDCGITSVAELEVARKLGLDAIVVDHHQLGPTLPPAVAVIDPHQPGCTFPSKDPCTAGLAFLLVVALRRALREAGHFGSTRAEPNLREYLDLVALGTIADVVPLRGINRILVKHGLTEIARSRRPGIRALTAVAGLTGTPTAGQVAFRLAPRINAAGRLADAKAGVELLTTTDAARAESLAKALDAANTERQAIEKRILEEALIQAETFRDARSLVLSAQGWHPGVIGIVAARVVERFHRPTFVVALHGEEGKGSGRSVEGFHLHQALTRCAEHLIRYGGHKHAAGLSLKARALPAFREALETEARASLGDGPMEGRCRIDALVGPNEIDQRLIEALERLAPFGAGNPEPVLASLGLSAQPRVLTSKSGGAGHLKLTLAAARHLDVIGFHLADKAALLGAGLFDAAFQVGLDEYQGVPRISLKLKDVRPGQEGVEAKRAKAEAV
ncbi:MAG: single-stranded-DNA-specific exonuclease RecJ [Deltaproteobacteria bacterium]|nr:single-stranded-DNA-specific exonuclease RecJ [Deltaproteobacteria bacterium]